LSCPMILYNASVAAVHVCPSTGSASRATNQGCRAVTWQWLFDCRGLQQSVDCCCARRLETQAYSSYAAFERLQQLRTRSAANSVSVNRKRLRRYQPNGRLYHCRGLQPSVDCCCARRLDTQAYSSYAAFEQLRTRSAVNSGSWKYLRILDR